MNTQEKTFLKGDLESFFNKRSLAKDNFNEKITSLKKEIEKELDKNHENVIGSINFGEIPIFLSEETRYKIFYGIEYPKTGITLLSIEILYIEKINFIGFEYDGDIIVRFNIKEDHYKNNWTEFPINNLRWDDKKFRIMEQSLSTGLDPIFNKEDYFEVKKTISELAEKVLNSIPKKAD